MQKEEQKLVSCYTFMEHVDMHIVAQLLALIWLKDALSGNQADDILGVGAD